jgi:hypothetical protein
VPQNSAVAQPASDATVSVRPLVGARPVHVVVHVVLVAVAIAAWADSLDRIDIRKVNDLGLISVLSPETLVALALLTTGFWILVLSRHAPTPLLLLYVVTLIVMLYATTNFVESEPRFAVTWRHVGIAQYVMTTGQVDPNIDAYFNWPGFFALVAFLTKVAGFGSPLELAGWAPVYYNLMYLAPLLIIFRSFSRDRRLWWFCAWLFYVTDWIGQDYFSPQGLTYFLYLVVLAIVLQCFVPDTTPFPGTIGKRLVAATSRFVSRTRGSARAPMRGRPDARLSPERRAALLIVAIAVFAAIVPSHQLTPFAVLTAVGLLALMGRLTARGMPVLLTVLVGTWISFMTVSYLSGHSRDVTGHAGKIEGTMAASVGNRLAGSSFHVLVVYDRLFLSVLLWLLAAAGAVRAFRQRTDIAPYVALALAPFPIVALQPYGGEILLRVYLFSLPFMVILVALVLWDRARLTAAASFAVMIVFLGGFLVARYGNERMDYFARDEVAAVTRLYEVAPPGARLYALTGNLPWKFRGYTSYRYDRVTASVDWGRIVHQPERGVSNLVDLMSGRPGPAYLIVTRSQVAAAELTNGVPASAIKRFEATIDASPRFRRIYGSRNAQIFSLQRRTGTPP